MAQDRIGDIEFFGYKGLDIASIRKALSVEEGGQYDNRTKDRVREAVAGVIGQGPTDVAGVCCDQKGNGMLYIGLPGATNKNFAYNPAPEGSERLSPDIMDLGARLYKAIEAAVRKGGDAAQEDDSNGYALTKDPTARSLQLEVREWALQHESELMRVLEFSSSPEHRQVASLAMGYARLSREQILALARAARDPNGGVRNDATRALGVIARSNAAVASEIPPDTFIEMLNSGTWSDRNKGASLLMELSAGRSPDLLARIRSAALDSLIEMALWRRPGHAFFARMVLGRIAGIPEDRLRDLALNGPVATIVEAVGR